jgi:hypothetical protein
MKVAASNKVPQAYDKGRIQDIVREVENAVNSMAEGRIVSRYNASTAAPSGGTYAKGDFIPNSDPSELGSGGSKYVVIGFICTVSGTPGTWLSCRCLTGN